MHDAGNILTTLVLARAHPFQARTDQVVHHSRDLFTHATSMQSIRQDCM